MKIYKNYTKELFSFLANDTTLPSDNPLGFRKNCYRNDCYSEKIKTIDNKMEQNKARYDLDKQTAKISAISSENVGKYEFSTV